MPLGIPSLDCAEAELVVEPFQGGDRTWDDFVDKQQNASFCHLAAWRGIMSDVMRGRPLFLVALDDHGGWHGALPLVEIRSRLFGHYVLSMPFLNYGGPVGAESACRVLAEAAVREASKVSADLLELRCRAPLHSDLSVSRRKVTVTLDLPDSADALWSERLSSKLRSQIRRPRKEGMEARIDDSQVDAFYEVFSRHMRDLGTPVLPSEWFTRIRNVLGEYVVFGTVRTASGEPVAAGCGFIWRDEFEMTWAAALHSHARSAPNMLLYWSFMEWSIAHGIRVFNFGRCTPGAGTHRFKLQWGSADEQLHWSQWSANGFDATPSPDGRAFRLATAAWRQLPLPIANSLGPRLARRLP